MQSNINTCQIFYKANKLLTLFNLNLSIYYIIFDFSNYFQFGLFVYLKD